MSASGSVNGIPHGKRSKDKGYIVLIGLTGAGKSTTLNSQFDLTGESEEECFHSATQSIFEYQVESRNKLGTCKKNLIVIDTPGFGDTLTSATKYQKDSQILATLESFLTQHNDLSNCYPTAVFLVIDFSDPRLDEEVSHFIQLLKGIQHLIKGGRLIDTNPTTCNLVIVLTHLMDAPEELQKCPEHKVRLIQGLIKTFTTIPAEIPVVMAENKWVDFELKENDGSYELPNGELYPLNLFKAFKNVTEKVENDAVAQVIVDVFGASQTLTKRLLQEEPLVSAETESARGYLKIIQNKETNVPENEMTQLLQKEWVKFSKHETKSNPIVLQVAKTIFSREGIDSTSEIPSDVEDILRLVRQLTVNPILEKILHNIDIDPPSLTDHCKSVGYFYNVRNDAATTVTPFLMTDQTITHSGFRAPALMRVEFIGNENAKVYIGMTNHQSMTEYFSNRFQSFNLSKENVGIGNKNADAVMGHNIIPNGAIPLKVTGIREFREYFVSLSPAIKFSPSYIKTLQGLPAYNEKTKHQWVDSLAHGVYVIKSAFIGGSISVTATKGNKVLQNTSLDSVKSTIKAILENAGKDNVNKKIQDIDGWSFELNFHGGNQNLAKPKLTNLLSERGRKLFDDWKKSIQFQPTLLFSEIQLEHISAYLKDYPPLAHSVSIAAHGAIGYNEYEDPAAPSRPNGNRKGTCSIV